MENGSAEERSRNGRTRRFAALRRALRSLTPSMRWPEALLPEAGDAELRAGLEPPAPDDATSLAPGAARLDTDALASLDEELDVLARRLAAELGVPELREELRDGEEADDPQPAAEVEAEARTLRVFATVCALGWALRDGQAEATLRELGADPDGVREHWLPVLEAWVHARTGAFLAAGHYEAARTLSDLKIRCLSPLRAEETQPRPSAPGQAACLETGRRAPSGSGNTPSARDPGNASDTAGGARSWEAPPSTERWGEVSGRADPGEEPLPETPPSEPTLPPTPEASRRRTRRALSLALIAALVSVAGWWLQPSAGSVEILGKGEIAALSPHLATGYRDVRGTRSIFIGTVTPSWERLGLAERIEAGRDLEGRLADDGVEEVMLFDRARRLTFHLRKGRLRHPAG